MLRRVLLALTMLGVVVSGGCRKVGVVVGGTGTSGAGGRATSGPAPAGPLSVQLAYENVDRSTQRAVHLLSGVTDDSSARAAARPLGQAAVELSEGVKQLKATVAALELAGRKAEVVQFYQNLAVKGEPMPADRLPSAIERAALSPQGPLLRAEINALLDALLEAVGIAQREGVRRWIQEKNLRR